MSDNTTLDRVARLIAPIVSDLHLDLYDLELRGGTLRVTVDRAAGFEGGLDLEAIALASRLIGRELDHDDPMAGHYTLEVSSPGLERSLRVPAHYRKSVGQTVALRLRDIDSAEGEPRRLQGVLVAAEDHAVTVRLDDTQQTQRTIPYDKIDRARTVFEWGPAPKPGSAPKKPRATAGGEGSASDEPHAARRGSAADEESAAELDDQSAAELDEESAREGSLR